MKKQQKNFLFDEPIMNTDGIVLLAKQPGLTSFGELHSVKKALGTTKVGHTGTLDSFAQGLLVICTGRLTRLAGNITDFTKTYQAVIKFGEETDTLEYTGKIIKKTELPQKQDFFNAVNSFTGNIMQSPPSFSAIHIDGIRSSDLMRSGIQTTLPARPVTIYDSKILQIQENNSNQVEYALIEFTVSKGTYIRSLARDIGTKCNSCAHLIGLYRTQVGNFSINDSAGFSKFEPFTIENSIRIMNEQKKLISSGKEINQRVQIKFENINGRKRKVFIPSQEELKLQEEIRNKRKDFDEETAKNCGFGIIHLISDEGYLDFQNGRPIRSKNFEKDLHTLPNNSITAAFSKDNEFAGLLEKNEEGRIHYKFVVN